MKKLLFIAALLFTLCCFGSNDINKLPAKVWLGMNGVPVLDQGMTLTCATFANTAALDAIIGEGDYISQDCTLSLGQYLENNTYTYSGWRGAYGKDVLQRLMDNGVVSKHFQCYRSTNISRYHQMSNDFSSIASWYSILDAESAPTNGVQVNDVLYKTKSAIAHGDRVTIGVRLEVNDDGLNASTNAKLDTWVFNWETLKNAFSDPFQGHEMIIIGYDDTLTATDTEGNIHKGMFILRNSWGEQNGDHGNFYMSYDYYKEMVIEAQGIHDNRRDMSILPPMGA